MRPSRLAGSVWPTATAGLALASLLTVSLAALLGWPTSLPFLVAAWFGSLSSVTFLAYGWDKRQSQLGGRRLPEACLHVLAFAGGTLGAIAGMRLFRHKTSKGSFRALFLVLTGVQVLLLVGLVWWYLAG